MERSAGRGWIDTSAASGIKLDLGVLYTWSVIKSGLALLFMTHPPLDDRIAALKRYAVS